LQKIFPIDDRKQLAEYQARARFDLRSSTNVQHMQMSAVFVPVSAIAAFANNPPVPNVSSPAGRS
jgi:hypothetical protein